MIGIARWLRYSDVLRASVFLTAVGLLETANGQSEVVSLREAMTRGAIAIESVAGTGGSSGTVLHGDLVNHNSAYYSIDVRLDTPLYFRNRSAGQNMVAVQLYGRDGSYMSDGTRGFVRVGPRARLPITFVAYCADFDKENPTVTDIFAIARMPPEISIVVQKIAAFESASPATDTTVAAQLALWVAQGQTLDEIGERFPFSMEDVAMMREILDTEYDLKEMPISEKTDGRHAGNPDANFPFD